MSTGYIYVLSNSAHPGLYKIGFTTDTVDARVASLSAATGVLVPFQIEYWRLTLRANDVERIVHAAFTAERSNPKREFSQANLDTIIEEIEKHVVDPPQTFRRVPPQPKVVDTRYTCKRCGAKFESGYLRRSCQNCGLWM